MQKVLTIVGLLTVVVTPAFAQDFSASWGTGNSGAVRVSSDHGR